MKQPTKKALLILTVGLLMTYAQDTSAQPNDPAAAQRITNARVAREENAMTVFVYANIGPLVGLLLSKNVPN